MIDLDPKPRTEKLLVQAAAQGSEDAFAELLAPYRTRLFGFLVRSMANRDLAEDLLQETLLRCWRGLPRYRDRGRFSAWLFAVARNTVHDAGRDHVRHRAVFADVPIDTVHEPVIEPAATAAIELRQRLAQVSAALDALPEDRREVFLLRQHGELSFREIAELLHQPLGTVLSHMHRALQELKKGVSDHAN